jgi:vesicle-fusing ATPase
VFRCGQRFFLERKTGEYLACEVTQVQLLSEMCGQDAGDNEIAQLTDDTNLYLGNGDGVVISGSMSAPKLLAPNFNYDELGIGGLNTEFMEIFRRAFATRLFPPAVIKNMGIKHVRGMLLFGPPGCGKTLIARQIGKMLNGRDPKVVNGPEILNKFVGQSEDNIRNLFADAEADLQENGDAAELHVIIFDEIDAICKQRTGSTQAGSHDTIVNQLLTKIDGVDAIDNILVIGMTNRKELLDEALLRPGRLEVHVEISLPDKEGRLQIFAIHTAGMRKNSYLDEDVDFDVLANETKNYTGAEIEGVCKGAAAFALFERNIDIENPTVPTNLSNICVTQADFRRAIADVPPVLGANSDELSPYMGHEMIDFGKRYHNLLREGKSFINQVSNNDRSSLLSVCFTGPSGSGKTALAAMLAAGSDLPFIKMISPQNLVGKHESEKCLKIAQTFDNAYKSPLSLIILDDLERLLEYVPIGPRFSNSVLQTLQILVKKPPPAGHRLLVFATTSNDDFLADCNLLPCFQLNVEVPLLTKPEIIATLAARGVFSDQTLAQIEKSIAFDIGIKQLILILEMAITNSEGDQVSAETFMSTASDCGYAMLQ